MKPKYFNSLMPKNNHIWSAKVLSMKVNPGHGPDLISNDKLIELKFAITPASKNYIKWTVLEYQMKYPDKNPNKQIFWGLGTYVLSKPVSEVKEKDKKILESLVISRELFIVN